MEHRKPSCLESFKETVEDLRSKHWKSDRFIRYYRADLDEQYDLLMLITEYTTLNTLRHTIDNYGFLDESATSKLIF